MNPNLRRGAIGEMRKIASEEGITALWKGVGPAMARAASLTASQLATYDESKQVLIRWTPLEEGFYLHLISSTIAGTVSTLITAPVDMIKTRLMLQRESKTVGTYKNGFHCAYQRKSKQTSMDSNSASCKASPSGSVKVNRENRKWGLSASDVVYHFGTSGMSVAAATAITHPLDVLKVRLQMQLVGQKGPLIGMGRLFVTVLKSEGPRFLYLGLTPALTRSVLYGGLRLGLYEPTKYVCELAFESTNVLVKIASGAFSGAFATALTNPVEVLKVRLQMNPNLRRGAIGEMRKIASEEGITALWKGVGPAMARAASLTASQLATYDESKRVKF